MVNYEKMDIWGYEYALTSSNSETIVTIDSIVVVAILDILVTIVKM